jgi:AcrR family transcriptional regulator
MYVTKRKTSRRTRGRIMEAVRQLLAAGTFHESTVEEVAALAGVSRATLYQHFGSRVGLVDALCETFDENPALVALRACDDPAELIALVVDFWEAEERILVQLYGVSAVDPAAKALVERQRRDRHGELRRLLRKLGSDDRRTFAGMSLLTSFETYLELRRNVGLSKRDVVRTLQDDAARLLHKPRLR